MSLEDRKAAFEKKFAHDEEFIFKVEARCSKLFGLWAAEQMGLSGADAETYAKQVVGSNLEEPGFNDVKRKVMPDLQAKGISHFDHVIDAKLEEFLEAARVQIMDASK